MAIFSRRDLDRMLAGNAHFLTRESTRKHVRALNGADARSIDAEWEIAVLHGLSLFGHVRHELPTPSGKRPDLWFTSSAITLVGEIVAVNDSGAEDRSPWERFSQECTRRLCKAGLTRGFHVSVGNLRKVEGKAASILPIPIPAEFAEFFNEDFNRFLESVKASPGDIGTFEHRSERVDIVISYDPTRAFFGADYPAYDLPQSVTKNPLYRALTRKVAQLGEARDDVPVVIFACDGGSQSLRSRSGAHPRTDRIVRSFLKNHTVTGIVLITIERKPRMPLMAEPPPYVRGEVYLHQRTDPSVARELRALCAELTVAMPAPEAEVANALQHVQQRPRILGRSFWGGLTVTESSISLSSRGVLELLAGTRTQETFLRDHAFVPFNGRQGGNPFAHFLKHGRLIERVDVERSASSDDDWLTFHFGAPDAAATAFREPSPHSGP